MTDTTLPYSFRTEFSCGVPRGRRPRIVNKKLKVRSPRPSTLTKNTGSFLPKTGIRTCLWTSFCRSWLGTNKLLITHPTYPFYRGSIYGGYRGYSPCGYRASEYKVSDTYDQSLFPLHTTRPSFLRQPEIIKGLTTSVRGTTGVFIWVTVSSKKITRFFRSHPNDSTGTSSLRQMDGSLPLLIH